MDDIPFHGPRPVFRHNLLLLYDQLDELGSAKVQQADDEAHEDHEGQNDQGAVEPLLLGGPGDLFQFVPHVFEGLRDNGGEILEESAHLGEKALLFSNFFLFISHLLHILTLIGSHGAGCASCRNGSTS